MNSNTENLLNLLHKYETSTTKQQESSESNNVWEDIPPKQNKNLEDLVPKVKMELEYCPQKVYYFRNKNYHYRREVDMNNNISWEIIHGSIRNKICDPYQIEIFEKRVSDIVN
jgi:hypothetical protein